MMRIGIVLAVLAISGCSYFQSGASSESPPSPVSKPAASRSSPAAVRVTTSVGLLKAMHDRYDGKYLRRMSFLQNNTAYTSTGQEQKSQWYEHLEVPGKLRIAFLPASQKSGLVQVDDRVASFDNGIRVDFRPSVNPLLLLTADVYVQPIAAIARGLDSLHVDEDVLRSDEWSGQPVYVVGAKARDSTSNQMWVDRDHLRLVRFIQHQKVGDRTIVSDIQVQNYKDIGGFEVPTEFLVIRNGRPVWREQYSDVRINEEFPPGTFDQARWNDIPIPK
ncbi:MAG: hypothetical protein NVSMB53_19760 [Gemmatimonadaceae bacterium]